MPHRAFAHLLEADLPGTRNMETEEAAAKRRTAVAPIGRPAVGGADRRAPGYSSGGLYIAAHIRRRTYCLFIVVFPENPLSLLLYFPLERL